MLSAPTLIPAGVRENLEGSGGQGGQVVTKIVMGPAASQWDVGSCRASLDIGEQGVVAGSGGERTVNHAQNEDSVEVESGKQSDGSDEYTGAEVRSLGGERLELDHHSLTKARRVGGRPQAVEDGQAVGRGPNGGQRFLFLGRPRVAVGGATEVGIAECGQPTRPFRPMFPR